MEGHAKDSLNAHPLGMNYLDHRESYLTFRSPSVYCFPNRLDSLPQNHPEDLDSDVSLMSDQLRKSRLKETTPGLSSSQIHFAKWYQIPPGANGGFHHRSSSLSPKPTEPTVHLTYRPPTPQVQAQQQVSASTPTHRGILKGQRPPSDVATDSPRGGLSGRGFWDNVDLNGDVNDSWNSIASSNLAADSLSRKTVRFADGEPANLSRNVQLNNDPARFSTIRNSGAISQGIYEWEPDDGLLLNNRDLNKPPRPPKLRPINRIERRNTTDCLGLASRLRFVPSCDSVTGVAAATQSPTPLDSTKGSDLGAIDDSYANYESIYSNQKRRSLESPAEVERIDSQRLEALMRPFKTSTESEASSTAIPMAPPPLSSPLHTNSGATGGPVYRTEVTITDMPLQSQSAPPSPPPTITSSFPSRFVYTVKPTSHRRSDTDSDIDDDLDKVEAVETIDDATLRPRSLHSPTGTLTPRILGTIPSGINGNRPIRTTRLVNNNRKQQKLRESGQMQQTKRHQPLRVDVLQSPTAKPPPHLNGKLLPPKRGPPFTDAPRRRSKDSADAQQPPSSTDLKTGSLDRDGVWRPNRLSSSCSSGAGGSTTSVAQGLSYPASPLLNNLMGGFLRPIHQRPRPPPCLFSFNPNIVGAGPSAPGGGYEVPIFVVPSATSSTNAGTPIPASPAFRHRTLSSSGIEIRRGINGTNVPIRRS